MYRVNANCNRNTLFVELEGFFQIEEAKVVVEKILLSAAQLQKGFIIINNISKLKPGLPEVADQIRICQKELFLKGASKAIRVVGDAFFSNVQFNRTQREAEANYELITVKTIEEAKQMIRMETSSPTAQAI